MGVSTVSNDCHVESASSDGPNGSHGLRNGIQIENRSDKAAILSSRKKPTLHPIEPAAIPQILKQYERWVGWQWRWNEQRHKWDKPPVNARTGGAGSSTNPSTWCSFDQAVAAVQAGKCDGVGFVLGKSDSIYFAGVDLDYCRDATTGELSGIAHDIIASMDTYSEVSPTGTGIKLLCVVTDPPGKPTKNRSGTVEVYSHGRYFTVTGQAVDGTSSRVEDRQEQLIAVWGKYINAGRSQSKTKMQAPSSDDILASGQVSNAALSAMLLHKATDNENDGSSRLFIVACRAVEHDLSDESAIATIRQYAQSHPFPAEWSDEQILQRIRDAEKRDDVVRGLAPKPKASSADPGSVASKIIAASMIDGMPCIRFWNESFWEWTNGRYVEIPTSEVRAKILNHFVLDWSHVRGEHVSNVAEHLRAKTILPSNFIPPAWLNAEHNGFNPHECLATVNRIIHLPSLIVQPAKCEVSATPAFLTVSACDFELALDAPHPQAWMSFLNSIWNDDPQSIGTLQEIFGYLLTADTRQQKIFLLIGPRRSGKGTIARILRKLVGEENVAGPTLSGLATQFGLSELVGKSLAIVSDARLSGRADQSVVVERLLAISGEDKLTIDRKHRSAVHCQLPTRFVILSNELPRLSDASATIVSRFVLLHTRHSFYGREDHGLFDKLTTELPGILLWAIEGWKRLRDRGHFVQPNTASESLDELTDLASPVTAFVRERCNVDPAKTVAIPSLFAEWGKWCQEQGHQAGTAQTFGRNLRAAISEVKLAGSQREAGGRTRYYGGIGLAV